MATKAPGGLSGLFDSNCGIPGFNYVQNPSMGLRLAVKCAAINAAPWLVIFGGGALALIVTHFVVKRTDPSDPTKEVPAVPLWLGLIPLVIAALISLSIPLAAARFKGSVTDWKRAESGGMTYEKWLETKNLNQNAQMQASAIGTAGMGMAAAFMESRL